MVKAAECDKDWIGMSICNICQKDLSIILNTRLKKTYCRKNFIPGEVCKECEEKYLKIGILFINPETGSIAVVKEEAVKGFMKPPELLARVLKERKCFTDEAFIQRLIKEGGQP